MPCPTLARAMLGAIFILCLQLMPVQAQSPVFVATTGSDVNNCSVVTPCRTLQAAHTAATPGGKIIVLDSGNFPSVTITKSIAIVATGVHANISNSSGAKITIDAAGNAVVDLDGLALGRDEISGGNTGIDFIFGARLHVRNCTIRGFDTAGIHIRGAGTKRVFISDCTIANNKHGVFVKPAGAGSSAVQLDHVKIAGNSGHGVRAVGSGAVVRVGNSTITNNARGLAAASGGTIISFGNNAIHGNAANGAATSTVSLK